MVYYYAVYARTLTIPISISLLILICSFSLLFTILIVRYNNKEDFQRFFGIPIKKVYGFELCLAKMLGFITETNEIYEMTLKGAFYYHYYENFYTLSYIDKMWGIMNKEAFPKELSF